MQKLILVFFFTCCLATSLAQNQNISIKTDSVSFKEVIAELKKKCDFNFLYSAKWVNSVKIKIDIENKPLDWVVQILAKEAGLKYFILDKNIVFTKDHNIKTNFKDDYISFREEQKVLKDTIKYSLPAIEKETISEVNLEYKLIKIGNSAISPGNPNATLHGNIRDIESGEPQIGVVIYFEKLKTGDVTDIYGSYSITIPKGQYRVEFRKVGLKTTYRNIDIQSDGKLDIEMKIQLTALREVTITATSEDKMRNLNLGVEKITLKALKQLPMGMGEPDIIKSTILLPGVQSAGEAANGFNVRGGSTDQNLFLLNGASIINTSHFFGFFSGFNSDIVKDITLYKSSIPANYGGRVSSVMDISLKEGSRRELKTSGTISPVSGRFTIEAPIVKDKSSFIASVRSTYSDWVLRMLDDSKLRKSNAGFEDMQGIMSFELDKKNSLYLSGYYSHDNFDYYMEDAYKYNSFASTVKLKHTYSPRFYSTISAIVSNYDYLLDSRQNPYYYYSMKYKLYQDNLKADFTYRPNIKNKINFGLNSVWYTLSPGDRKPLNDTSQIAAKRIDKERALETAIYIDDEFKGPSQCNSLCRNKILLLHDVWPRK